MESIWGSLIYGSSKGKDLILEVLSSRFPLSAKLIYYTIKKQFGSCLTYQAIHKFLKELTKQKILLENNKEYMINLQWLINLNQHIDHVKAIYTKESNLKINLAEKNNPLQILAEYKKKLLEILKPFASLQIPFVKNSYLTEWGCREIYNKKKNILNELEKNKNILLLGDPGSGKTTICKRIAYTLAINSSLMPFFVNLKTETIINLNKLIEKRIQEFTNKKIDPIIISNLLKDGAFLFILDGLNEIEENMKKNMIKNINQLIKKFNKNHFLITCRKSSDPKNELQISTFELQDLTYHQMKLILFQKNSKELYVKIKNNQNILRLCKNPLFLTLAMRIFKQKNTNLIKQIDLYKNYVEILLYQYEQQNNKEKLLIPDVLESLAEIAFITKYNHKSVTNKDLKKAFSKRFEREDFSFAYHKIFSSELLIEKNVNNFEFFHQSIQDYLCALHLSHVFDKKIPNKIINLLINKEIWRDVIKFYCTLQPDNNLFKELFEKYRKSSKIKELILLAQILKENKSEKKSVFNEILDSLLNIYSLDDKKFYQYWNELNKIFSDWNSSKIRKKIIYYFSSSNSNITARMTNILFHSKFFINHEEVKNLFIKGLKSPDKHLKYSLIELIGIHKFKNFIPLILNHIEDKDFILRAVTIWAIEQNGEEAHSFLSKTKKNPFEYINKFKKGLFPKLAKLINKTRIDFKKGHCMIELARLDYFKALNLIFKNINKKPITKHHACYALTRNKDFDLTHILEYIWSNRLDKIQIEEVIKNMEEEKKWKKMN